MKDSVAAQRKEPAPNRITKDDDRHTLISFRALVS